MKGYKNYNEINFSKIFEEYQNNNLTQTEISKKYNIPYSTFNSRYVKWKMQYMSGGKKNNDSEKISDIFVKKEKSDKNEIGKNIMDIMQNAGGRGVRNKHSGFTDILDKVEQTKKNNNDGNNDKKPKRISGILNQGLDIEIGKYSK